MVVSFDWYKYSFFLGFRKREEGGLAGGLSEDPFVLSAKIKSEVRDCVRRGAVKGLGKEEMLRSLGLVLEPYTRLVSLRVYAFRVAICNAIEEELKKYYSIDLGRRELLDLWKSPE